MCGWKGGIVAVQRVMDDSRKTQGVIESLEVPEGTCGDDAGKVEGTDGFVPEDAEGSGTE